MVSGLKSETYHSIQNEKNQIENEQAMREQAIQEIETRPKCEIKLGEIGIEGHKWRYHCLGGHSMVDLSETAQIPIKYDGYAATTIISECAQKIKIAIWNYMAITLFVNEKKVCKTQAVYKPMRRTTCTIDLQEGKNELFVVMQNVGIRDTRNIFGIEVLESEDEFKEQYCDYHNVKSLLEAERWLQQVKVKGCTLMIPKHEFAVYVKSEMGNEVLQADTWNIPEGLALFELQVTLREGIVSRSFEIYHHHTANYSNSASTEEKQEQLMKALASEPYQAREGGARFSVYHVLARYAVNQVTENDEKLLLDDLSWIEKCVDCSDFLMAGFIRLLKKYQVSRKLEERIKEVFLTYRYWMDESGNDGMCFWSENHALMFFSAQLFAGERYPDEYFTRSGRSGREQYKLGYLRCEDWLTSIERNGLDEFCSATYTGVTVAALLNVVDFAPQCLSERAKKILDDIFLNMSEHVFDGVIIAPQGRVYRSVITPFQQSAQELVHYIDSGAPTVRYYKGAETMWLSFLATSQYEFKAYLSEVIKRESSKIYVSGNARICLHKTGEYIMTSVESPRQDNYRGERVEYEPFSMEWVRKINEAYHGRTLFEPGVFGYQQHLWYASLAHNCCVFTNHPGVSADRSQMRPGYWHGNGIIPAIKQHKNILACIYHIPKDKHPIKFTHLFWPKNCFEETVQIGNWLFGRVNERYIAIWCNVKLEEYDDVLSECELRANSRDSAYVCICGNGIGFERFREQCTNKRVYYALDEKKLYIDDKIYLSYQIYEDNTQYI